MPEPKPVPWCALPDEQLNVLGRRPSLVHATAAITDMARRWGRKEDALVIVHRGVIDQESSDGVIHRDALTPMHAAAALGEPAGPPSTADRLACAIALLSEHAVGVDDVTRTRAQRVVSDILLEHPALLHPRLVIPFCRPGNGWIEYMPVLAALVASRMGALPSLTHGVDMERLRRFANSPLARAPFERKAPDHAWTLGRDTRSPGRQEVAASGEVLHAAWMRFGSPSPAFLTSVFEMRRLDESGKDLLTAGRKMNGIEHEMFRRALPLSFGLHRHRGAQGFQQSPACPAFLEELRRSGMVEQEAFVGNLPSLLVEAILVKWTTSRPNWDASASPEMARANTWLVLEGLVECGLAKTRLAAASWLYDDVLSEQRPLDRVLPEAGVQSAVGFMLGLADAGLGLGDLPPHENRAGNMRSLVGNAARWQAAHEVSSRHQAMDRVLQNVGRADRRNPAPLRRQRSI